MNTYFDCAATTKPNPLVKRDVFLSLQNDWYNPSANYNNAREVKLKLDHAREQIANYINCEPEEIYFTSGATEANNWAMYWNMLGNENITHVFTDTIEHPSIYQLFKKNRGSDLPICHTNMFPVSNFSGEINLKAVKNILKKTFNNKYVGNFIVGVSMVNNEVGTIFPIKIISDYISKYCSGYFHVDATQAFTHMPIDVKELGIDTMSSSFHKYGGVKGIGFLYCRKGVPLTPMLLGGHQENNMRAGTENVHYITAMGNHIERLSKTDKERWAKVEQLSKYLTEQLYNTYSIHNCPIRKNGGENCSPYINSFTITNISAKDLITLLDMDGIQISAGSACSSGENKPSRVLKALGLSDAEARSTIRISIDENNDKEGIDYLCYKLTTHINFLKK